mgnify:CR=1 FL=1
MCARTHFSCVIGWGQATVPPTKILRVSVMKMVPQKAPAIVPKKHGGKDDSKKMVDVKKDDGKKEKKSHSPTKTPTPKPKPTPAPTPAPKPVQVVAMRF